jgi:hypothetical protein
MKTIAMHKLAALLLIVLIQFCIQNSAFSQSVLNYQGRVVSGGTVFSGTGQFKFALVSKDGSKTFWKNDGTVSDTPPNAAIALPVTKGLFSVQLGDSEIANMALIPPAAFGNAGLKLRVWFNDGTKGWQQFSPDQPVNLQYPTSNSFGTQTASGTTTKTGAILTSLDLVVPSATLISLGKGDWVEFNMDFGVMSSVINPLIASDGRYFYIIGGYDPASKNAEVPVSKVYKYDPRSQEANVVCDMQNIYYRPNTAPLGYNNRFTSAIQNGFKWSLIGGRIYIAGGGEQAYSRQIFGFFDTLMDSWNELDDLVGNASGSSPIGSISRLSDGFVYLITGKTTVDGYANFHYYNTLQKHSVETGWIRGGSLVPEAEITSASVFSQLTGGGFFRNDNLYWFDSIDTGWNLISGSVFGSSVSKVTLDQIRPETDVTPSFSAQGYGGTSKTVAAYNICEVNDVFYMLYKELLYQIDVRNSKVAKRFSSPIVPPEGARGFAIECDGRLYLFMRTTTDGRAWKGYSASLQSLRNVFIQN